jgi:hypothetical protein
MGLFSRIKQFFKETVQEPVRENNPSLDNQENWSYLLQKVITLIEQQKLLREVFSIKWDNVSIDEKDEAANRIRKFVTRALIPMAGGLSMMGAPGIFVYTPCQLAGAMAIARIYDSRISLSLESAMTVMSIILWGKLGQVTWIHIVELIPLPGLGVVVIPFVMGWTTIALENVKKYYRIQNDTRHTDIKTGEYREKTTEEVSNIIVEATKNLEENTVPADQDNFSNPIDLKDLAERIKNGGKVLYPAQAKVFRELVDNSDTLTLGKTHSFRGVAGSGKTIILAHLIPHLFTKFQDMYLREPRILVFHHNTYARQMLRKEVNSAFKQPMRLEPFPDRIPQQKVFIHTLTTLINYLDNKDLLYFKPQSTLNREQTAKDLHRALKSYDGTFDIILIDEGQDLDRSQYSLLLDLCSSDNETGGKSLFVFYDDLQNIFGQRGNVESKLPHDTIKHFLPQCVRTSKRIMNFIFNTCLTSSLNEDDKNKLQEELNFQMLKNNNLISERVMSDGGTWMDCDFCVFPGNINPYVERFLSNEECFQSLGNELEEFLADQELRGILKYGILILCFKNNLAEQLYNYLAKNLGEDVKLRSSNNVRTNEKLNSLAVEPACVNIANIWDAKGYDADIVYIINPDEGGGSEYEKRIRFYVSATRAKQILGIYSTAPKDVTPIFNDAEIAGKKMLYLDTISDY